MDRIIELAKAIAVTAELTGTELSESAKKVMVDDLAKYDHMQIIGSLDRCRKEIKGRLTIADVIARLDDGRPGPEEAWAMLPKSENETIVWTDEMAQAFGVSSELDDNVQARMAFLEVYRKLITDAREKGIKVKWTPSIGFDKSGRAHALRDAVIKGRLSSDRANMFLLGTDESIPKSLEPAVRNLLTCDK